MIVERTIRVHSIGRDIAKIMDREGVKPPLNFQAWHDIHAIIYAALLEEHEATLDAEAQNVEEI